MKRVVSERRYYHDISFEIVKEWENVLCEKLHSDIICLHMNFFIKLWNRAVLYYIPFKTDRKRWRLGLVFSAGSDRPFRTKNVIPVYIDFHPRVMDKVIRDTRKLPCFFVTSQNICNMINQKSKVNNCYFVPLSIPDRYISNVPSEKKIDVIQMGRKNNILHRYMLEYCEKNPEIEYVYMSDRERGEYISTVRGKIGRVQTRQEYFSMLRSSKISLVSSPGMDSSSRRYSGETDFFTPRFYESVAARCFLIGRYSDNEECEKIGIKKVCKSVENFPEFEEQMDRFLHQDIEDEEATYLEFLQNNCTTRRIDDILRIMKNKGFKI